MFIVGRVLVLASILIVSIFAQTLAHTDAENLQYIKKILKLLNNNEKCELPTYDEIHVLQQSFDELANNRGEEAASKLTDDQKLVIEHLLDQWKSFELYVSKHDIIKSAKFRAFISKIIHYQEHKYGSSICAHETDKRDHEDDEDEFKGNPLVEYVKQMKKAGRGENKGITPAVVNHHHNVADHAPTKLVVTEVEQQLTPQTSTAKHSGLKSTFEVQPMDGQVDSRGRPYRGRITYSNNQMPGQITFDLFRDE